MANIWNADFTGITVDNSPSGTFGVHEGTFVGSVTMNYDSSTAASSAGLTFTDKTVEHLGLPGIPSGSVTFTTFALTAETVDGVAGWQLTSIALVSSGFVSLSMTWQGTNPPELASAAIIGTGGQVYDSLNSSTNDITWIEVCFAAGTLIRTPGGDVRVERLKIGDLVLTASGEFCPVKWLGHRDFDFRSHPNSRPMFPIRIAADAFGPNRPSQDLFLSSGHSVCIDLCGEVFIPVRNLVNGATIAEVEVETISYWHVELDSHDILIANNLPAESYLAMANRGFFKERPACFPQTRRDASGPTTICRPVALDGLVLDFVRQRLIARAEAIGWTRSFETDLHLVVDGEVRRPLCEGDAALFLFRAGARDVRLKSKTSIPALVAGGDPRSSGFRWSGSSFRTAAERRVPLLDDERLKDAPPRGGAGRRRLRRTKGELVFSPDFWAGLPGPVALTVTHGGAVTRNGSGRQRRSPRRRA